MNTTVSAAIDRLITDPALDSDIGADDVVAEGFGRELVCVRDCTDSFATTTDPRTILLQALLRRFITPRGGLPAHDDDDYGFNLLGLLHVGLTQTELRTMHGKIVGEMKKDPRVDMATARLTYAANRLTVTGLITPRDPSLEPFEYVMTADAAAVTIAAERGVT